MTQLELFRSSILVKYYGMLCLMKINAAGLGPAECPQCKGIRFSNCDDGWTYCTNCNDFAMLTKHLVEVAKQWNVSLSVGQ